MKRSETEEMYLETILVLGREQQRVRKVDLAACLNVSKPSVTTYMKTLVDRELVRIAEHGSICLTEEGRQIAEEVYEKHRLIKQLLLRIGAGAADAEENACRIEHVASPGLIEAIRRFLSRPADSCE